MIDIAMQLLQLAGVMLFTALLLGFVVYRILSALMGVLINSVILLIEASKEKLKKAWKRLRDIVRGREPERPKLPELPKVSA